MSVQGEYKEQSEGVTMIHTYDPPSTLGLRGDPEADAAKES